MHLCTYAPVPSVLFALNPLYAIRFFLDNGMHGFLVLGAVFLVTTGGEALYADLGHFGEKPIQVDWFNLVGPSLMLQYLGQGALLRHPEAAHDPRVYSGCVTPAVTATADLRSARHR